MAQAVTVDITLLVDPLSTKLDKPTAFRVRIPLRCVLAMADLHDDVTYDGWGKSSAAGHRECMGNSERVLRRSVSLLLGKADRLHALIFATQRVGVFISESDGCIGLFHLMSRPPPPTDEQPVTNLCKTSKPPRTTDYCSV